MANQKLVSIIVPVFNSEKFIRQCIDSILGQTYINYELVLVDDGSTDGSWEIINSYIHKYPQILAIQKENGGANSARKKGLELAQGDYIIFVDADDYIDPSFASKLINIMEKEEVDIVLSKVAKVLNEEIIGIIGKLTEGKYKGNFIAENMIDTTRFFIGNMIIGLCANLYKRECADSIFSSIDLRIRVYEDFPCAILMLLDSKYVYFLDECLYFYRQNSSSVTHNYKNSNYSSLKYLYSYLTRELKKRNVSSLIYKEVEWVIIENLLIGGYDIFKNKEYLYPFDNVKKESRIIIYGAGLWGSGLVSAIKQFHLCKIVLWVDKNWKKYQSNENIVSRVDEINNVEFDYIIIAVLNPEVVGEIRRDLEKRGIESTKIVSLDQKLITYRELPEVFWK